MDNKEKIEKLEHKLFQQKKNFVVIEQKLRDLEYDKDEFRIKESDL